MIGRKIYKYDKVGSTNDVAFIRAQEGEKEGAVIWALEQSKGRGRLGRIWVSRKGKGLFFSIILTPEISLNEAPLLILTAAVAIVKVLRKSCKKDFLIKWPNDIVIDDKKICGILTEMESEPGRVRFIILGIGINTNLKISELPIEESTSAKIESGKEVDEENLLFLVLKELDNYYAIFKKKGAEKILKEARDLCCLWGRQIKIDDGRKHRIEGTAVDFSEEGGLIIRQNNGFLKTIFAGDVKLLR